MEAQVWRTPETVRAYLDALPDGATAGLCASSGDCTLARCYRAIAGGPVNLDQRWVVVEGEISRTHEWEYDFVRTHDKVSRNANNVPITKEEALAILTSVTAPS